MSRTAHYPGLAELLDDELKLKRRRRGSDDVEVMLSLIYCLAHGDGKLLDVKRLCGDKVRRSLLGSSEVPGHRRMGKYLARFDDDAVRNLLSVAHEVASRVSSEVIARHLKEDGYIPVFIDGSAVPRPHDHILCPPI